MYREFYKLASEPFRVTPDPDFLFLTDQYKEALAAIVYGIEQRKGFICITGEVGVGKTTILRSWLDTVERGKGLRIVYLFNPNLAFPSLLRLVLRELGVTPASEDPAEMAEQLHEWLVAAWQGGTNVVLLVDEAQNMPPATLENLRMLSNLEAANDKLLQIVLVGQPELEELLARHELRQLRSRIAVQARLGPMSEEESLNYIQHRLNRVALDRSPIFSPRAARLIVREAGGIPRLINILCDNALITGYGYRKRPVTPGIVREIIRDRQPKGRRLWPRLVLASGMAALLAVAAGAATMQQTALGQNVVDGVAALRGMIPRALLNNGPEVADAALSAPMPPPVQAEAAPPPRQAAAAPAPAVPSATAAQPAAPPSAGPHPAKPVKERVVQRGDTLSGLAIQIYGRSDRPVLDWLRRHNPGLTDIDMLQVGQTVAFPDYPGGQTASAQ